MSAAKPSAIPSEEKEDYHNVLVRLGDEIDLLSLTNDYIVAVSSLSENNNSRKTDDESGIGTNDSFATSNTGDASDSLPVSEMVSLCTRVGTVILSSPCDSYSSNSNTNANTNTNTNDKTNTNTEPRSNAWKKMFQKIIQTYDIYRRHARAKSILDLRRSLLRCDYPSSSKGRDGITLSCRRRWFHHQDSCGSRLQEEEEGQDDEEKDVENVEDEEDEDSIIMGKGEGGREENEVGEMVEGVEAVVVHAARLVELDLVHDLVLRHLGVNDLSNAKCVEKRRKDLNKKNTDSFSNNHIDAEDKNDHHDHDETSNDKRQDCVNPTGSSSLRNNSSSFLDGVLIEFCRPIVERTRYHFLGAGFGLGLGLALGCVDGKSGNDKDRGTGGQQSSSSSTPAPNRPIDRLPESLFQYLREILVVNGVLDLVRDDIGAILSVVEARVRDDITLGTARSRPSNASSIPASRLVLTRTTIMNDAERVGGYCGRYLLSKIVHLSYHILQSSRFFRHPRIVGYGGGNGTDVPLSNLSSTSSLPSSSVNAEDSNQDQMQDHGLGSDSPILICAAIEQILRFDELLADLWMTRTKISPCGDTSDDNGYTFGSSSSGSGAIYTAAKPKIIVQAIIPRLAEALIASDLPILKWWTSIEVSFAMRALKASSFDHSKNDDDDCDFRRMPFPPIAETFVSLMIPLRRKMDMIAPAWTTVTATASNTTKTGTTPGKINAPAYLASKAIIPLCNEFLDRVHSYASYLRDDLRSLLPGRMRGMVGAVTGSSAPSSLPLSSVSTSSKSCYINAKQLATNVHGWINVVATTQAASHALLLSSLSRKIRDSEQEGEEKRSRGEGGKEERDDKGVDSSVSRVDWKWVVMGGRKLTTDVDDDMKRFSESLLRLGNAAVDTFGDLFVDEILSSFRCGGGGLLGAAGGLASYLMQCPHLLSSPLSVEDETNEHDDNYARKSVDEGNRGKDEALESRLKKEKKEKSDQKLSLGLVEVARILRIVVGVCDDRIKLAGTAGIMEVAANNASFAPIVIRRAITSRLAIMFLDAILVDNDNGMRDGTRINKQGALTFASDVRCITGLFVDTEKGKERVDHEYDTVTFQKLLQMLDLISIDNRRILTLHQALKGLVAVVRLEEGCDLEFDSIRHKDKCYLQGQEQQHLPLNYTSFESDDRIMDEAVGMLKAWGYSSLPLRDAIGIINRRTSNLF